MAFTLGLGYHPHQPKYTIGQTVEVDVPGQFGMYGWQPATIIRYVPWTKDAPQWPAGWVLEGNDHGDKYEFFAETNRMRPIN